MGELGIEEMAIISENTHTNVLTFNRSRSFVTQAIRQIRNEKAIQTTLSNFLISNVETLGLTLM